MSHTMQTMLWALAWPALTAVANTLLRAKTPEEWVEMADKNPAAHGAITALRGAGLDPAKVVRGLGALARYLWSRVVAKWGAK